MAPPIKSTQGKPIIPPVFTETGENQGSPIPTAWQETTIQHLKNPCLCAAFILALGDKKNIIRWPVLPPEIVKSAFDSAIETVKNSRWGTVEELKNKKTGEIANGSFIRFKNGKEKNVLCLHVDLLGIKGEKTNLKVAPDISRHEVVFLHEALHAVVAAIIEKMKFDEIPEENEHPFIDHVLTHYFREGFSEAIAFLKADSENFLHYKDLETSCRLVGCCDTPKEGESGERRMAPPIETVVQNPMDINNDGVLDDVGSYAQFNGHQTEENGKITWGCYIEEIPHTPVLRNPKTESEIYSFDRYEECPTRLRDNQDVAWSIREMGRFDAILNFWVRFYNQTRTMSFMPGERAIILHESAPQIIRGIVVFVDEGNDTFRDEVYAQFDDCRLVPIDQLALIMADGERLDMERVRGRMAGQSVSEATPSEERIAGLLQSIEDGFADRIERVRRLPKVARAAELPLLRQEAFEEIRKISKNVEGIPSGWENGALTLMGLPIMSQPIVAQRTPTP